MRGFEQFINQVILWTLCQLDGNVGDELVDRGHRSRNKRPPAAQSRPRFLLQTANAIVRHLLETAASTPRCRRDEAVDLDCDDAIGKDYISR